MDFLPGLFSATYFVIRLEGRSGEPGAVLEAGGAIQRFWLMATKLGLVMQPCVAMLAFWSYAAAGRDFTALPKAQAMARRLASRAEAVLGPNDEIVFLGRIGWPWSRSPSRSIRLPLARLMDGRAR
jgi:hypothetical protein